ncbi:hypothetical protein RMATCC62417_13027 [Rhizopus microsporus]|nr:hypothetical protein RMATCC62417_13027 [Rhizopus microsporus]
MSVIAKVCKSSGPKFSQSTTLLPGTKAVHLLGTNDAMDDSSKKNGPASYDLIDHLSVREECKKSKETLQQEMQSLQAEATAIEKQLKDALKNEKRRDFSIEMNGLKLKWRSSSLEERSCLYNDIKQLKDERNQSFLSV